MLPHCAPPKHFPHEAHRVFLILRERTVFDELLALKWSPTADGKVRMEAKADLKSRLGRSPDRADAVVMAFSFELTRRRASTFKWTVR